MSVEMKQTKIGDNEYSCVTLNASKALRLMPKLVKYLGSAFLVFLENKQDQKEMLKDLMDIMGEKLDSDEFFAIFKEMVMSCGKNGKRLSDFDIEFNGNLMEPIQVFAFALRSNFNFFTNLLDMMPEEKQNMETKAQTSKN